MAYDPAFPADNAYVKDIPAAIRQKGEDVRVPAGMVGYFAGSSAPTGWLECNGSAVSRTTYADLFTAIGTTYGTGDGATTFNLPDLRGEFLRVLDSGRGIDSGRVLGSTQEEAYKSHNHTGLSSSTGAHTHGATASSSSTGAHTHTITSSSSSTGAHAHTITSSSNSTGSHAHTASVTLNSSGAHGHTVSGTAASAGAHTHTLRNYLSEWGSIPDATAGIEHNPARGNDQSVRDSTNAVLSAGAHTHTVSGSAASAGSHTHTGSVSVSSAGAHSHTINSSSNSTGAHTHEITSSSDSNGAHSHAITVTEPSAGNHAHGITVGNSGGAETRPRNIALMACIKV